MCTSQKNGTQGAIDNVDLYSEFICLHGTHIKKRSLETGYADSFRTGPSIFGPGLVGLRNMGNTCYMNSMLQCLSACEPLVKYMMKPDKMKSEINLKNALGTGGEVADAFRRLISVVWSGKASEVVPRDFKTCFGVHNNKFAEYVLFFLRVFYTTSLEHQHHRYMKQQDSMEMFSALMDNLHEDLNRVTKKPVTEPVEDKSRPDDVVAKEAWEVYMRRNDSVVVDTFFGQDKSQLWCPDCEKDGKSRRKFDPRLAIHVNVPSDSKMKLNVYMFRLKSSTVMCVEIPEKSKGKDLVDEVSRQIGVPISRLYACEVKNGKTSKTLWNPTVVIDGHCVSDDLSALSTTCVYEIEEHDNSVLLEIVTEFEGIVGFRRNFTFPFVLSCSSDVNDTKRIQLVKQRLLFYRSENMPESPNIRISFHTLDTNKVCAEVMISISSDAFFKSSFRESLTKTVFGNTNKRSKEAMLTLKQCLESTFKKEQLGDKDTWFCPDCKNHVRAFKQMWIWKLADTVVRCVRARSARILIISLKYYEQHCITHSYECTFEYCEYCLYYFTNIVKLYTRIHHEETLEHQRSNTGTSLETFHSNHGRFQCTQQEKTYTHSDSS